MAERSLQKREKTKDKNLSFFDSEVHGGLVADLVIFILDMKHIVSFQGKIKRYTLIKVSETRMRMDIFYRGLAWGLDDRFGR